MQIRDARNGSWFWVNTAINSCTHLSAIDKVVYGALCTFAGCREIHPSYPEISKRSATSERRCKESIQNLIKRECISVQKGGGKGNANVYTLLKVPKGCVLCTVSNGAESDTQTVRITTANGADCAPQLNKEINKELDNSEANASQVVSLIDSFKEINPAFNTWYANKTQRSSSKWLIENYGLEAAQKMISSLSEINHMPYAPITTTPTQLKDNIGRIKAFLEKKQNNQPKIWI